MGWGTNEKAQEKKERDIQKKKDNQRNENEKKEKEKWKDEVTDKKQESAQQKEERRLQELAKKRELKELAEREEAEMEKGNKKEKGAFKEKKLTQAEIMERQEKRLTEEMDRLNGNQTEDYPEENVNKKLEGYEIASSVDQALNILDDSEERHPERRFKAAFEAYCEKREEVLKIDYPKFKRSQRQQMMRKEFEKHPENPYNKKNIVAYNHSIKKEEVKEEKEEN